MTAAAVSIMAAITQTVFMRDPLRLVALLRRYSLSCVSPRSHRRLPVGVALERRDQQPLHSCDLAVERLTARSEPTSITWT